MKNAFRPSLTLLEERRLLSSAGHHLHAAAIVEHNAKPASHSITGSFEGRFEYIVQPINNPGGPQYYSLNLTMTNGQLNQIPLGGMASISGNLGRFIPGSSGMGVGRDAPRSANSASLNTKVNLQFKVLESPFAPSLTIPASFDILVRLKSANGRFKRDVHHVYAMTVSTSVTHSYGNDFGTGITPTILNVFGNFTATFRPA